MAAAPWYTHRDTGWLYESEDARNPLAILANPEHARRIAAAVNATAGMSVEELESFGTGELAEMGRAWMADDNG